MTIIEYHIFWTSSLSLQRHINEAARQGYRLHSVAPDGEERYMVVMEMQITNQGDKSQ